jgi:hypothetical protein
MASDLGGRAARRLGDQKRRRRIVFRAVAAGAVVIAIVVVGIIVVTREDEKTTSSASSSKRVTTTSSSTSSTTTSTLPVPTTVVPRSPNPVVALAQQYDGYYEGTWTNQASGATGPATLEVRIDPVANTLTSKASFDGDFFGGGAKALRAIESSITIGDPNAPVAVETEAFGPVTARIDASLALILDAPNVPDSKVKAFTLTGRLNDTRNGFAATYTVTYENGTTAQGVVNVTCAANNQRPSDVQTLCPAA